MYTHTHTHTTVCWGCQLQLPTLHSGNSLKKIRVNKENYHNESENEVCQFHTRSLTFTLSYFDLSLLILKCFYTIFVIIHSLLQWLMPILNINDGISLYNLYVIPCELNLRFLNWCLLDNVLCSRAQKPRPPTVQTLWLCGIADQKEKNKSVG